MLALVCGDYLMSALPDEPAKPAAAKAAAEEPAKKSAEPQPAGDTKAAKTPAAPNPVEASPAKPPLREPLPSEAKKEAPSAEAHVGSPIGYLYRRVTGGTDIHIGG